MKRLTTWTLAIGAIAVGGLSAQDFLPAQGGGPNFFGLPQAGDAPGPPGFHEPGRGRRGHRGPHGPAFQGFVLGGGEGGYGLITIRLRPPRKHPDAFPGDEGGYPDGGPDFDGVTRRHRPRFEGFVRVDGQAYGVVNLERERVSQYEEYESQEPATGTAGPRRRELARISADLVPLRRRRPRAGDSEPGGWPGSWLGGESDELRAPTGRLRGSIVAFGPPPPRRSPDFDFQESTSNRGGASGVDALPARRHGRRGGGLVFEGEVVTEETSGQVLARMGPPRHERRGHPGGGGGAGYGHPPMPFEGGEPVPLPFDGEPVPMPFEGSEPVPGAEYDGGDMGSPEFFGDEAMY